MPSEIESVCVCVVVSGSKLTRYRAKDSKKKMIPEKNSKEVEEDDDDDE